MFIKSKKCKTLFQITATSRTTLAQNEHNNPLPRRQVTFSKRIAIILYIYIYIYNLQSVNEILKKDMESFVICDDGTNRLQDVK